MTARKLRSKNETHAHWRVDEKGWRPFALVQGVEKDELLKRKAEDSKTFGYTRVNNDEASLKPVQRANPWMDESTVAEVVRGVIGAIENSESELFARHALNGFLAETDLSLVFGDWLDEHREELLNRCDSLEILQTPHFEGIFTYSNDFVRPDAPVLLRATASKAVYNALAKRNLAEVNAIFSSPIGRDKTSASSVDTKIEAILAAHKGIKVDLPKFEFIERKLRRAFVTLFVSESDSNFDKLEPATLLVEKELRRIEKCSFSNPVRAIFGDASTAEIEVFADWLLQNAGAFRFYDFLVLLHALRNPASLIKRPPEGTRSVLALYSEVINKTDDPVATFKNIVQILIAVRTERPTLDTWIESIQDGTVEGSIDPKLTSLLMVDGDSKAPVFQELAEMRRAMAHFLRG